jgi:hypothetical protein
VAPAELIRWRRVLATLAARQEGNAVTTLIRDEHDIVKEAGRQELRGDIPKILKTLAKHRWRLLRHVIGSTNGAALQYSLGHDALAVALLKWDEAQHSLEEAEQARLKARRKLQTYALAFICVLLAVAGMHAWKDFSSSDERSKRLAEFSNVDDARNFRLRVQLLSAALAISQGRWSLFISGREARKKLESALLLSPVQSGAGDTIGLSDDGTRIAALDGKTIREFEVGNGSEVQSSAYTLPPDPIDLSNVPGISTIGFVANSQSPVLYKEGYLYRRGMAPMQIRDLYPQSFDKADNPRFVPVDFVQGLVQAILPDRFDDPENWVEVLRALPPGENTVALGSSQHVAARIVWYGPQHWPVLSTRSDNAAYVGKPRDKDIYTGIVLTSLSNPTFTTLLHAFPKDRPAEYDSYISMVFADSGNALVVRDSQTTLRIFSTARDLRSRLLLRERPTPVIQIPDILQGRVQPRRPNMRPLLAASKAGGEWRFAWLTPDGVAAIKTQLSVPDAVAVLSDSQLLTGPVDLENAYRLSFSSDGRYLTLVLRPRMPTMAGRRDPMRYLVWDLNRSRVDFAKLSDEQLRDEACAVARLDRMVDAESMVGLLTKAEKFIWFDGWATPCAQQSQGLDVN